MHGWLIHNAYFFTQAFRDQTDRFSAAAESRGIRLDCLSNAEARVRLTGQYGSDKPDFVLFWDKDLPLARDLEDAGLPVFNSSESVRLCDDKILTFQALRKSGICMPETIPVPFAFSGVNWDAEPFVDAAASVLGYPLVIKAAHGSFGQQVWLAQNRTELVARLNALSPEPALLQRFVASSAGRDKRLYVVGNKVAAAMVRTSKGDFRANIALGGSGEAAEADEEEREIALRACADLGLTFGGVDLLFGEDGHPLLCEVNSNAHIKNLSFLSGIPLADEILSEVLNRLAEKWN